MTISVSLSWFEYHWAVFCATLRIVESTRQQAKAIEWNGDREQNDIQAAGAEIAVAKALNQYWCGGVNAFRQPDVGLNIEVRRTKYPKGKLAVRPRDHDDRPFVLVRGAIPEFEVVGWIYGFEAKQDRWKEDPHGEGEVYMVPDEVLKDCECLFWREPESNKSAPAE